MKLFNPGLVCFSEALKSCSFRPRVVPVHRLDVFLTVCVLWPSVGVALLCSFLLGLGDSCFNTQLLSIIGFMFRDNSAPAFAVFKFMQVSFINVLFCSYRGPVSLCLLCRSLSQTQRCVFSPVHHGRSGLLLQ